MIDTLGITVAGKVKKLIPTGWKRQHWSDGLTSLDGGFIALPTGILKHKTGLRIGVTGGRVHWAEVEMSRLLFETNGILIRSQAQLDQAVRNLIELMRQVCRLDANQSFKIRRIDLVGHCEASPQLLIRAYKHFPVPNIHGEPFHYPRSGLFWKGTNMKCRIYDKALKSVGRAGNLSRIEWELHSKVIFRIFRRPLTMGDLSIEECYSVFQRLTQQFTPRPLSSRGNLTSILAMANEEGWCFRGVSVAQHVEAWRNPRVFKRMTAQAASVQLHLMNVDLGSHFPLEFQAYRPVDIPGTFAD